MWAILIAVLIIIIVIIISKYPSFQVVNGSAAHVVLLEENHQIIMVWRDVGFFSSNSMLLPLIPQQHANHYNSALIENSRKQ